MALPTSLKLNISKLKPHVCLNQKIITNWLTCGREHQDQRVRHSSQVCEGSSPGGAQQQAGPGKYIDRQTAGHATTLKRQCDHFFMPKNGCFLLPKAFIRCGYSIWTPRRYNFSYFFLSLMLYYGTGTLSFVVVAKL